MPHLETSRRGFLQGSGALVVSFALAGRGPAFAQGAPAAGKTVALNEVDGFLAIGADGRVTVFSGKVDLGTGVRTALTQMAAEELDVPLDRVTVIQGDTALTPDQGPTYGSLSVQSGGVQIRQAAATARRRLMRTSGAEAERRPGQLRDRGRRGEAESGRPRIPYGELVNGGAFALKIDKEVATKDPATFKIVGKPVPRLDIPDKTTGRFTYMQDYRMPGMLHGRVVRPAAIGATLEIVDDNAAKAIPGVVRIVREGNFLGVVAETEWGAIRAAQALNRPGRNAHNLPEQSRLWEHVRATKVTKDDVTSNVGDVDQALPGAAKTLKATYDFAIHTHGSIGPSCAIAEIKDGKLTCWTASQMTHNLRKQLAAMMRMPDDDVRCIYVEGSGCYGRNGHEDAAADAALLARAVGRRCGCNGRAPTSTAGTRRARRR